jgi:hypothetical protein
VLGCFRPTGACTAAISDGLDHRTLASCWSDGSRAYFDGSAYQGYYELRGADGSICAACWWESSGAGSFACVREGRMIYVYPDEPAFPSGYPAPVEVGCFGGAVERYCLADRGLFFSCVPVFPFFGCPRGECAGPAPDGGTPDGHPPSG